MNHAARQSFARVKIATDVSFTFCISSTHVMVARIFRIFLRPASRNVLLRALLREFPLDISRVTFLFFLSFFFSFINFIVHVTSIEQLLRTLDDSTEPNVRSYIDIPPTSRNVRSVSYSRNDIPVCSIVQRRQILVSDLLSVLFRSADFEFKLGVGRERGLAVPLRSTSSVVCLYIHKIEEAYADSK